MVQSRATHVRPTIYGCVYLQRVDSTSRLRTLLLVVVALNCGPPFDSDSQAARLHKLRDLHIQLITAG